MALPGSPVPRGIAAQALKGRPRVLHSIDDVEPLGTNAEDGMGLSSQGFAEAEAKLWNHEFFRDCMAPKVLTLKVRLGPPPPRVAYLAVACST